MARTARTAPVAKSTKARAPAIQIKIAGGAVKLAAALGIRKEPTLDGKTPLLQRAAFTVVADTEGLIFKNISALTKATRFLRKRAATPAVLARAKFIGLESLDEVAIRRAHIIKGRSGFTLEAAE